MKALVFDISEKHAWQFIGSCTSSSFGDGQIRGLFVRAMSIVRTTHRLSHVVADVWCL